MNDRDRTIDTLLGREPLTGLTDEAARLHFAGLTVLISGAAGSIGSELVRTLSTLPCHIIAYDRSEIGLTRLIAEHAKGSWKARLTPFLGDINQSNLLNLAFRTHRPGLVIHAAAYKHLPLLEYFPIQAVTNNVIGAREVLLTAVHYETPKFLLVSTDKACNPTSVMGATKRVAEMSTLNPFTTAGKHTRPIVVRLGNVLGSSGSVLPLFEAQIAAGGPLTVTHPDATRFFMSLQEAASLILTSAAMGEGYETFVPDMGEPVNIADLARRLVELRCKRVSGKIDPFEIKFTGMRPGEKLTEQLFIGDRTLTAHPRIWTVKNEVEGRFISTYWNALERALDQCDANAVMTYLQRMAPEYTPIDNSQGGS